MEPARTVVEILGGTERVSELLGISATQVWRWQAPKGQSAGTGGVVPSKWHKPLMDWAREHNKPLKHKHFFVENVVQDEVRRKAS
jgi:hypothetical protein